MVIRKRPELDMENPPGQIRLPRCANSQTCTCTPGRCEDKSYGVQPVRYLRDVIKKYQDADQPKKPLRIEATCALMNWAWAPIPEDQVEGYKKGGWKIRYLYEGPAPKESN